MIRIKRILCPTDLSTGADQALAYALALTQAYEARLVVCHCVKAAEVLGERSFPTKPPMRTAEVAYAMSRGRVKGIFEGSLLNLLGPVGYANLDWEAVVIEGEDVGEAIIQTASEQDIDLIVMRSRRRPHRAAVLGSTAESVCRNAPCPVLVTDNDERKCVDQSDGKIKLERLLVAYDFSDYS